MSASPDEPAAGATAKRWETLSAVLLALAAVATAWSSYQASRWTGEQAKTFSAANAARVESAKASDLANSQTQVDVATFTQWVDARLNNEPALATFYERRFRDEFKPAFQAWLDMDPFRDADAPPTPFAMPEYRVASRAEAAGLERSANELAEEARGDVERATRYVLCVVLFAIVLFFAGISTKLEAPGLRRIVLGAGVAVLVVGIGWVATFPISISI